MLYLVREAKRVLGNYSLEKGFCHHLSMYDCMQAPLQNARMWGDVVIMFALCMLGL